MDCVSLLNWIWGYYILCITKAAFKKIEALIRSMKCLLKLFFISIKLSYGLLWNTVAMPVLVLPVAIWICRTVGLSLVASLKPFTHHRNLTSLILFCKYYFGSCSTELAKLVPPYSWGGLFLIFLSPSLFIC